MNKDEKKMIEDIKKILIRAYGRTRTNAEDYICRKQVEALYNANCRILADDEIVIKKSEYENLTKTYAAINSEAYYCGLSVGEQETASEIFQELYDEAMRYSNEVVELTALEIKQLAKERGIELED